MILKKNSVSARIIRKLELKKFYFGNFISWKWHRPMFARAFKLGVRMNPHIVITGESGGGKSNACRLLIKELCNSGSSIIALDPNGDYLGIADSINADVYDSSRYGINIFDLDGASEAERISELMTVLARRLKLGHVQSALLKKCIGYSYWIMKARNRTPTLKDVLYTIRVFEKRSGGSELRILGTLFERLSLLNTNAVLKNIEIEKVMKRNSIFLLSTLHTEEAQSVYMEVLLRKIYSRMMGSGYSRKPLYLIIDEARKISGSRVLGRLTAEGRKYGIGIITVSQRARKWTGTY
jgi:DNA helicase HerA-like ATPase